MNIIKSRQEERAKRIASMQQSIKKSEHPDLDMLIMLVCNEWGISTRTAKEYLKIALFNVEHEAK